MAILLTRALALTFVAAPTGCALLTSLDGFTGGSGNADASSGGVASDAASDGAATEGGGGTDGAGTDAGAAKSALVVVGGRRADIPVTTASVAPILEDGGLGAWQESAFVDAQRFFTIYVGSRGPNVFVLSSPTTYTGTLQADRTPSWTVQPDLGRDDFCTTVAGDSVIVTGGQKGGTAVASVLSSRAGATLSWSETKELVEPRQLHGCAANERFVYVVAGKNASGDHQSTVFYAERSTSGELGPWKFTIPLPATGYLPGAVVIGSRLAVIGGELDGVPAASVYHAHIRADGSIESWQLGTPIPEDLHGARVVAAGSRVYVVSGFTDGKETGSVYTTTIDPETGAMAPWTPTTSLPGGRQFHGAAIVTY